MSYGSLKSNASPDTSAQISFPEIIICLSHLRWDFVYQRPQHLMSRMAERANVYFIEEPLFDAQVAHYSYAEKAPNLTVVVPHLPQGTSAEDATGMQQQLLEKLTQELNMRSAALWYYTPMALSFSRNLKPAITVFDCMDELSAFKFAPQSLKDLEEELLRRADVVFTGGASLYAAKHHRHNNIHLFASSIDSAHFGQARKEMAEPEDQRKIPHPRLGFFGVIDERFDIALIDEIARQRPQWHIVLVGPVVKIDPAALPGRANIHYTGGKSYNELPAYLSGWDIAMIPFAMNESTRFISPTKTPEYLAAGIPVISTPIRDVVAPYGDAGLVHIAATADEFIAAAEQVFSSSASRKAWLAEVDAFLDGNSWDATCAAMQQQLSYAFTDSKKPAASKAEIA